MIDDIYVTGGGTVHTEQPGRAQADPGCAVPRYPGVETGALPLEDSSGGGRGLQQLELNFNSSS